MASFNPAFVTHTTPSGRHSTQNVMQNQAIPGSFARSIHYMAEKFPFSGSLLTELTKPEKICHMARAVLWWGHQTVLLPFPTNFFTGIHHNFQEHKVGSMGRWVELGEGCTLGPTNLSKCGHAKGWSYNLQNMLMPLCSRWWSCSVLKQGLWPEFLNSSL